MTKKIKYNQNSRILVKKIIKEFERDGQKYIQTKWFEVIEPLNFGSLNKPQNTDITEVKFEVPSDKRDNSFGGLFK